MTAFRSAHAAADSWREAVAGCIAGLGASSGANALGFLYVTDRFAPHLPEILEALRRETGVADWIGTAGIGIAANGVTSDGTSGCIEYYDRPAIAAMIADLPAESFRVFEPVHGGVGPLRARHGAWLQRANPMVALVHADPRNPLTESIVSGLSNELGAFLVGGLTSSRAGFPQIAERVVEGGVSGVLFAGDLPVATGLSQGCSPIGPVRVITEAEDNVVKAIDGRPALELFLEDIGELLARDLQRVAGYIFAALPVTGSDTGDYMVRNLVAIDRGKGWIGIGAPVEAGDRIMFTRRDRAAAEKDLQRMLADLAKRAGKAPIRGGVYCSCVARGHNLFGDNSEELTMIRDALGDFPLVGFFANGEICHNRLYGYTGVLTLFL